MEKVWLRKCASFEEEEEADREFWAQMTGDERVEALEQMRQDAWMITGERLEGLRRTVRVLGRNVRFLVLGGYAFAFHARPRYTKDLDIFVEPTPENARCLLQALADFGFGSLDFTEDDFTRPDRPTRSSTQPGGLLDDAQGSDLRRGMGAPSRGPLR